MWFWLRFLNLVLELKLVLRSKSYDDVPMCNWWATQLYMNSRLSKCLILPLKLTIYIFWNISLRKLWLFVVYIQLDWPSETETLKINLPRDQEGYLRRIWICGWKVLDEAHPLVRWAKLHFYFYWVFLRNNFPNNDTYAMELGSPHSWMCFVKSCNTEVSGASEVPQSVANWFFGSPAAVFLLKN